MARLILRGQVADVELTVEPTEGGVVATCLGHSVSPMECTWTETYDSMDDATEYAADHADEGRQ